MIDRYGEIAAAWENPGHPITPFDAQIAAICRSHDAPLATRNTADFIDTGVEVINPWTT